MKIVKPSVKLLHVTPRAQQVIERAGRVCWKSEDLITQDSYVNFIRMIKSKNHESVLEHASAGFLILTDRGITHELVRHRIASYSQESSRYCNYSKGKFEGHIRVIKPSEINDKKNQFSWMMACDDAETHYLEMINRGVKAQIARSVLPTCLASEIVMTANFREWRHFIQLRCSAAAHPDMQIVANMIRTKLKKIAPIVFEDV